MIVAVAKLAQCPILYSEDLQNGQAFDRPSKMVLRNQLVGAQSTVLPRLAEFNYRCTHTKVFPPSRDAENVMWSCSGHGIVADSIRLNCVGKRNSS